MAQEWRLSDGTQLVFDDGPVSFEEAQEAAAHMEVEVEWEIGEAGD